MARYVPAMALDDLPEGGMASVEVEGVRVLLSKIGGEVSALSGTCTHEEADLGLGFVVEDRVVCPLHLSQFELKTGTAVNPPATEPLRKFNAKIEGGTILVEV